MATVLPAMAVVDIPKVPLAVRQNIKPLVMLVASKDHRLFYEAYNDASDVDGDGTLDLRFKPGITYLGLFHSDLCYSYNDKSGNEGQFTPAALANQPGRTCIKRWSGNWLNYITTSRVDALRVVLYGGMREVDTETQTILRRAYIPQDAHSWAKEYTSESVDRFKISDYTPLSQPNAGKRHFFGNYTPNAYTHCTTLENCSGLAPLLAVVEDSGKRVWEWASSEGPVLRDSMHGGTRTAYTVRVVSCPAGYTHGCKTYGNTAKPVGLLHDFGETDTMLFGLLTGSYDQNMSGGRLRKVVSPFSSEVNAATGQFTQNAVIVQTFNALRIRDFNNGDKNADYRGGWLYDRIPKEGEFPDWGNPIGEMMYESLRYFAGKSKSSKDFDDPAEVSVDQSVGLKSRPWDDPYQNSSAAKAPMCARANLLVISDVNVSYDSDQVGGAHESFSKKSFVGDLAGFSAVDEAKTITEGEPDVKGARFIGQSGSVYDGAPTPKEVESLGSVRGLAPEAPTQQGSYTAAAAAYFGKRTDLQPDLPGRQNVETFVVALASPLPRLLVPVAGGKLITLTPFAKTVADAFKDFTSKASLQPTNQIVDFYIEQMANSGPGDRDPKVNEGRYFARFRINYENVEQGGNHDMDAIVLYEIQANADGSVTVTLTPEYEAGHQKHRMGYVITGTKNDGVYLEVQDQDDKTEYYLNTPPGLQPKACDVEKNVPAACDRLPFLGARRPNAAKASRTFEPGSTPAASFLKDPLWYAAKWGGFIDRNGNDKPDLTSEWDADGDGVPDAYLPVQNPTKLKQALRITLENIAARASSASSLVASSTSVSSETLVYEASFNTQRWSGELIARRVSQANSANTTAWQASAQQNDWQSRKILVNAASGGVAPISTATFSNASVAVVDYLRGERKNETQFGRVLRDRQSLLGDIVHSTPVYDRDTGTVYVGANDGMLHAFNATNGQELFAFIPRQVLGQLPQLASPAYTHQYLVDGDLALSGRSALTNNRSYLYALLGRGGKGLFSLDVTQPSAFGATSFLWEYTPEGSVTAAADADLGLMLGRPVTARLNNGKLGVLVGNGYNSQSEKAVLYIFIINTDGSLDQVRKIGAGTERDNGLAGPTVIDTNGDGKMDLVYAGDLQGNVWKFDIGSVDPATWGLALGGSAVFQARNASSQIQPITAPLFVAMNDRAGDPNFGKRFIFFGTGAYFRTGDPTDLRPQSWYGLIDPDSAPIGSDRSLLRQRTISSIGKLGDKPVRVFSESVANDMQGLKGWYIDLDDPGSSPPGRIARGERIVTASRIGNFSVPALIVNSLYPINSDPCLAGGSGYVNAVDPFTGGALALGIFDLNDNGNFTDDKLGTRHIGSIDLGVGLPGETLLLAQSSGRQVGMLSGTNTGSGSVGQGEKPPGRVKMNGPLVIKRRLSWREIVRD